MVPVVDLNAYVEKNVGTATQVGADFPLVGWCMINTVSRNHVEMRKVARGIAKQRLCHTTFAGPARMTLIV